eukprot:544895-Pelagomonas_calceolata.AAC.10
MVGGPIHVATQHCPDHAYGQCWALAEGGVQFADKPNIPFKLLGYTDLAEKDFVYFKTAGGHWVGAAEDEAGRLFMIDEVRTATVCFVRLVCAFFQPDQGAVSQR